ncbi:MAG: hypothetical protein QXO75_11585, partial [Nitrososphaerota archaeon]
IRVYFFVSFLSIYLYYAIFVLIRAADLNDRISVKDALLRFSRVYKIMDGKKSIMSEIPASSAKLDEHSSFSICLSLRKALQKLYLLIQFQINNGDR